MTRINRLARKTRIAPITAAAAIGIGSLVAPALAAKPHWSKAHCELQQSIFNVQHTHPSKRQLAAGDRALKQHGCRQRVPGPKHWSRTQCGDYQGTFYKLYASPSRRQLAAANRALKQHGCRQRVKKPRAA